MKRFTESTKWHDPWFRRLSPTAKLLWGFLCDNCDYSGVIDLDYESFSFHIGEKVTSDHLKELGFRVEVAGDKILIPKFISFQFKTLRETAPLHRKVMELVASRRLIQDASGYHFPTSGAADDAAPIPPAPLPPKEQKAPRAVFVPPTREQLNAKAKEIGMSDDEVTNFVLFYSSKGWMVGKNKMASWEAALHRWHRNNGGDGQQKIFGEPETKSNLEKHGLQRSGPNVW